MKLLKTKFGLIITSLIVSIIIIIVILWMSATGMITKMGNINVTKIQESDKLYSYTLFGDYYFRIQSFNDKGDKVFQLSELVPIRAYLGYKNNGTCLVPFIYANHEGKPMVLSEHGESSNETNELIESLKKFSKTYIKIVATQDEKLFIAAKNRAQEINKNLFNKNNKLVPFKSDTYYEKDIKLPIDNIILKPPKLNNLKKKIKSEKVCPKNKWSPNIVKWTFNESDTIYLQYLEQFHSNNLDDYIKSKIDQKMFKDNIVVKTIKPYNGDVQKIFFEISLKNNKIKSFYIDENGYVYILIFHANSRVSLMKNLQSYLKISYGLSFIEVKNFTNSFATKQNKLINIGKNISNLWIDILYIISKYEDTVLGPNLSKTVNNRLGKYINLSKVTNLNKNTIKHLAFVGKYTDFEVIKQLNKQNLDKYKNEIGFGFNEMIKYKNILGDYPNEEMLQKFKKLNNYVIRLDNAVSEAKEQMGPFKSHKYKNILERCNNLECIENINKEKGW